MQVLFAKPYCSLTTYNRRWYKESNFPKNFPPLRALSNMYLPTLRFLTNQIKVVLNQHVKSEKLFN